MILIFWNDEDHIKLFKFVLKEKGYQVDGVRTLDECIQYCQDRNPDLLILCRVGKREDEGLEHVKMIRSNAAIPYFPIIVGWADLAEKSKGDPTFVDIFAVGANAGFGRVFDTRDVCDLVQDLLDHPKKSGLVDRQATKDYLQGDASK